MFHQVVLIQIQCLARPAPGSPEGDFAQTTDFLQYVGRILPVDDVNLVVILIGGPQASFGGQF